MGCRGRSHRRPALQRNYLKKNKCIEEKEKEKGKIKDVSEAFEEYPVEEWHKGKVESLSYLREKKSFQNYNK